MDIKRHVYQTLLKWKNDNCHTTLEVNGARQVGKTYIINKFADENFSHKVYINLFELSGEQFISCYQKACNWRPGEGPRPQAPLHDAFRLFDENFSDTEDTVIIIDEIQESAEIYNRIREFTRQFRCRFIVTGSYLGRIYEPEFRYSSGDVTSIQIYTLSYEEFLEAADTDLFEKYKLLGKKLDSAEKISLLMQTPAAALGSCRYKLGDPEENKEDFEEILQIFRRHEIRYFIYIGGNDSMDTVDKMSKYCKENGVDDVFVVGAPKTIDNDLVETDHCPGFGSAAKYLAATFAELERDCHVYEKKAVTIVEVMGRNAGWLTAASALSRVNGGEGPSLIYLCEPVFDTEQFLKDVQEKLEQKDSVLVAISEGIHDSEGRYVSEQVQSDAQDQFGHSYIAGSAKVLEELVRDRIGCKVRSIELNLMQRCAAHLASATDLEESRMLGMKACQCALEKQGGQMASIRRISADPYRVEYTSVPVSEVANKEKKVPLSWITEDGHDVTEEMMAYLRPLILGEPAMQYENGIPVHIELY